MLIPTLALRGIFRPFLAYALLASATGCKPAATPNADHSSSPEGQSPQTQGDSSRHQPSTGDFADFLRTLLPPALKVAEIKSESPVRMPNTSPVSNTWLIGVKITLVPTDDLLALPAQEDARSVDALVTELNGLISWHNAYVHSPYAQIYGEFEVKAPMSSAPQLLVIQQPKGRSLPPIYGKICAEWKVDHWDFENIDLQLPELGKLRSDFNGSAVVVGTPEADTFLAMERKAITEAKEKKAAIERSYADDLIKATKPGTIYTGKISHRIGVLPCQLRFMDQPPGGDPQMATFEIRLLNEPNYQFVYTARMVTPMPVGAPLDSANPESSKVPDGSDSSPVGNLTVNFANGHGPDEDGKTLPGMVMRGQKGKYTHHDQPFVVLNHHIKGIVSQYSNGEFVLTAQQNP